MQGVGPCHGRRSAEACQAGFLRATVPVNMPQNAGLSCEARAASSTSAPQKNSRTPKGTLRGTCQGRANFRDARGRTVPWKVLCRGVPSRVSALNRSCQHVTKRWSFVRSQSCFKHLCTEKTEEPRRAPLGEHVKTERIFRDARGRPMPWKVLCRGVPRSSLPLQEYTCRGPRRRQKKHTCRGPVFPPGMMPAKVLSAAQRVYLQRSSPPTRNDAYRGPLCRTGGIPAEVLSAHPR